VTSTHVTAASTTPLRHEAVRAVVGVAEIAEVVARAETIEPEVIAMAEKSPIVAAVTTVIKVVHAAEVVGGIEIKARIETQTVTAMAETQSQRSQDHGTTMRLSWTTMAIRNSEPASVKEAIVNTTTDRLDHAADVGEDADEDEDVVAMMKMKVATRTTKMTSITITKRILIQETLTPTTARKTVLALAIAADEDEMMVVAKDEAMVVMKEATKDGHLDVVDRAAVVIVSQARRSTTAQFQLGTMQSPG